jgi:hypothetical protein
MPACAQISCIEVWWNPDRAKQLLRRREDFVAPVGLQLDVGAPHEIVPRNKIERTFIRL